MQLIYGASPTSAGLRMMPMVAVTIPSSIIAGIISSKTGKYVFFPKIGMAILSVAMGLASTWNPDTSLGQQIGYLCINGLGMGLVSSMIMLVVQANLPVIDLGPGTTVASFVRSVGGVVGIGIGGTIMQSIIGGQLNASSVIALSTQLGLSPMLVGGLIKEFAEGVTPPLPTGVSQSQFDTVARFTRQAYSDGLTKVFLSVAAATAVGWVFSMFITHANLRTSMGEKGADEGKDAAKGSEGDVEKGEAVQMAPVAAAQATPTIESENSEHETVEIEDDYPAQSTRASAPTNGTA